MSLYRLRQLILTSCDKYNVSEENRVSILTDGLEGQALHFFLDNIAGQTDSLRTAFERLADRFDSPHSRAQAQSYLESTTIASIREEKRCSTAQALDFAIKRISSAAPMCGPQYQHESHKSSWLASMLKHEAWAQPCLANRMTMAQGYQTFIAALHAALTQLSISESQDKSNVNTPSQMALPTTPSSAYFGQRYAMPPKTAQRNTALSAYPGTVALTKTAHEMFEMRKDGTLARGM